MSPCGIFCCQTNIPSVPKATLKKSIKTNDHKVMSCTSYEYNCTITVCVHGISCVRVCVHVCVYIPQKWCLASKTRGKINRYEVVGSIAKVQWACQRVVVLIRRSCTYSNLLFHSVHISVIYSGSRK